MIYYCHQLLSLNQTEEYAVAERTVMATEQADHRSLGDQDDVPSRCKSHETDDTACPSALPLAAERYVPCQSPRSYSPCCATADLKLA